MILKKVSIAMKMQLRARLKRKWKWKCWAFSQDSRHNGQISLAFLPSHLRQLLILIPFKLIFSSMGMNISSCTDLKELEHTCVRHPFSSVYLSTRDRFSSPAAALTRNHVDDWLSLRTTTRLPHPLFLSINFTFLSSFSPLSKQVDYPAFPHILSM